MALSANTVLECRVSGSDTNGGGFVTGASGTDWSQQDSAQYSVTDGVTAGTTTITSATASFGTDVVGNLIYVQGGTGGVTAGWYQIVSRTNSTTIVVDRSTGLTAGTGVTLKIGGALATPGQAGGVGWVAGMKAFLKYNASAYVLSNTTPNTAGGPFAISSGGESTISWLVGYDTTRTITNTDANRPTIQVPGAGVSSITVVNLSATYSGLRCRNIIVDGNGKTSIVGFAGATGGAVFRNCKALTCTTGFSTVRGTKLFADVCGTGFSGQSGTLRGCASRAHTSLGFSMNDDRQLEFCLAVNGTGGSTDGFLFSASNGQGGLTNCVAHGNGRQGFSFNAGNLRSGARHCVATSNGAYGFITASSTTAGEFVANAGHNNTSGNTSFTYADQSDGFVTLTGDPWANAAGAATATTLEDLFACFLPNNTAGAGTALRAAGYPAFQDIGAAQHQDAGGSAGARLVGASALVTPGALVC